jgi:hypothetical protein
VPLVLYNERATELRLGEAIVRNAGPDALALSPRQPTQGYADLVKAFNLYHAYWRLGENVGVNTAIDEKGAHHGTFVNNPARTTGALFGDPKLAVSLRAAASQYVATTTLGTLGANLHTSTWSCFVKTTSTASQTIYGLVNTGTSMIVQCRSNTASNGNDTAAGWTAFKIRGNSAVQSAGAVNAPELYDGQWHHLIWESPANNSPFNCWVDGVKRTVVMGGFGTLATPINFDFPLALGAFNVRGTHSEFFDGEIDEMAVWALPFGAAHALNLPQAWGGTGSIRVAQGNRVRVQGTQYAQSLGRSAVELKQPERPRVTKDPSNLIFVDDYLTGDTDETRGIQAAFDDASPNSVIQFSDRTYTLQSPPRADRNGFSVLALPGHNILWPGASGPQGRIIVRGGGGTWGTRTKLHYTGPATAYSTTSGVPSILGGPTYEQITPGGFIKTLQGIDLQDLSVTTTTDPTISGIDLHAFIDSKVSDVEISSGQGPVAQQTSNWTFGLRMPGNLNFGRSYLDDVRVFGFYYGYVIHMSHLFVTKMLHKWCTVGLGLNSGNNQTALSDPHGSKIAYVDSAWCEWHIAGWTPSSGSASLPAARQFHLNIDNLDIEDKAASPFDTTQHVLDANNQIFGNIGYTRVLENSGRVPGPLTLSGGTSIDFDDLMS